jgi:hypothetical protein
VAHAETAQECRRDIYGRILCAETEGLSAYGMPVRNLVVQRIAVPRE